MVCYCMFLLSVNEANTQAVGSGLLPVQTQNHIITCLVRLHVFALSALQDI